jgi:hypothetical protein
MTDDRRSDSPLVIEIAGRDARATIRESAGYVTVCRRTNGWTTETVPIRVPYQSDLTNLVAEALLTEGACGLTDYSESARLHRAYLAAFLQHLERVTGSTQDVCPIT